MEVRIDGQLEIQLDERLVQIGISVAPICDICPYIYSCILAITPSILL